MILPLSAIWTSRNVCQKTVVFNMDSDNFISWTVEEGFFNITAINNITSSNLDVAYYDSIANAETGTATGRLALGQASVNTYLATIGWASGEALRIYNTLGNTLQAGEIVYKASPSESVPCGLQTTPYIAGLSEVFDGVFVRNQITTWNQLERTDPYSMLFQFYLDSLGSTQILLAQGTTSASGGGYLGDRGLVVALLSDGRLGLLMYNNESGVGNRLFVRTAAGAIQAGNYYSILISSDGSSNASGITLEINEELMTNDVVYDNLTATIKQPSLNNLDIGAFINAGTFTNFFDGRLRKAQVINNDYGNTATGRQAQRVGSFEVLIPDSEFLLDIDYNKTALPLTTRTGTPTYTVNNIGGFTSTKYIP